MYAPKLQKQQMTTCCPKMIQLGSRKQITNKLTIKRRKASKCSLLEQQKASQKNFLVMKKAFSSCSSLNLILLKVNQPFSFHSWPCHRPYDWRDEGKKGKNRKTIFCSSLPHQKANYLPAPSSRQFFCLPRKSERRNHNKKRWW